MISIDTMQEENRPHSSRKTSDWMTDELIAILQEAGVLEFDEIFQRAISVMKKKRMSMSGAEILRLRVYEKLQRLASAGGISKKGSVYTALPKLGVLRSDKGDGGLPTRKT